MGSAGSGRFGTYRTAKSQVEIENGNDGVGGGIGEFECPSNIENIRLEDVATSNYYVTHKSLPSNGEPVELNNTIYRKRIVEISAERLVYQGYLCLFIFCDPRLTLLLLPDRFRWQL